MNSPATETAPATALAAAAALAARRMVDATLSRAERDEAIAAAVATARRLDHSLLSVAADPDVPAHILDMLSYSVDRRHRLAVAGNASARAETLDVLLLEARRDDTEMLVAVAANPNAHPDTLDYLASADVTGQFADTAPLLRALAANPAAARGTLSTVASAADDADTEVLAALALHPNTAPRLQSSRACVAALRSTQGGAQAPDSVPASIETTPWARVVSVDYDYDNDDEPGIEVAVAAGQRLGDAFRDALGEPTAAVHVHSGGGFRMWALDSAAGTGFRYVSGDVIDVKAELEPDRGLDL